MGFHVIVTDHQLKKIRIFFEKSRNLVQANIEMMEHVQDRILVEGDLDLIYAGENLLQLFVYLDLIVQTNHKLRSF